MITPNATQRFAPHNISPTSVPSQPLKQKSSFAQLGNRLFSLGTLFAQPTLTDDAAPRFIPADVPSAIARNSPRSVSSAASSEQLDGSDGSPEEATYRINPLVFEAQSVEAQQRALDWVATTNHALSSFTKPPVAAVKRVVTCPAPPAVSASAPLTPAHPITLTSETFLEAAMEAADLSGTAQINLHRTLKHAKSVPALRQPAIGAPRQYVKRSALPASPMQPITRQPKLLRKAASCAVLRAAPLTPLLTLDPNNSTPTKRKSSGDEKTRVVKLPSPERAETVVPRGRRQDVRSLWRRSCADENQLPERDGEFQIIRGFNEPGIRTFESTYDGGSEVPLGSAAGSLKAVLGRTRNQQCLPFKVGLMPPRGGWQEQEAPPQIRIEDCSEDQQC